MEDLTGLGKIAESVAKLAESELAIKAYDDLLADAMKEGGKTLADTVKAFRLFTAPIQLLALAQDRLASFCEKVRSKVPEDRQQEAAPSIALPILMDLRFMEDDNPLTELYLNLLARAIDKERCSEAHPAFVKIIEQMSPDEAMVMYVLRDRSIKICFAKGNEPSIIVAGYTRISETDFPASRIASPTNLWMYLKRLEALTLLTHTYGVGSIDALRHHSPHKNHTYHLTDFGRLFVDACIPEDFGNDNDAPPLPDYQWPFVPPESQ